MRTLRAGVVACILLGSAWARAHGGTPVAQAILVHPTDPEHVLVASQFGGFFLTRDGGTRWEWICEQAVGYQSNDAPPAALAASGTAAISVPFKGIAVGATDTCSFPLWSANATDPMFADVRLAADDPEQVMALRSNYLDGGYVTEIWRGNPAQASFSRVGQPLSTDLIGVTAGVAPSDPERLYVSGGLLDLESGDTLPVLETSADGGQSFSRYAPSLEGTLRLIAVTPDPNVAVFRLEGPAGIDQIVVFTGGGTAHRSVFTGAGVLPGGALSPDGSEIAIAGPDDGIWRASVAEVAGGKSDAFVKVSSVWSHALTWTNDGLYSGGSPVTDGFVVGVSKDRGQTFEPFLVLCRVTGPVSCAEACPLEGDLGWSSLTTFFPPSSCDDEPPDAAPDAPADAPAGNATAASCACRGGPRGSASSALGALLVLGAWSLAELRFRRRRSAP